MGKYLYIHYFSINNNTLDSFFKRLVHSITRIQDLLPIFCHLRFFNSLVQILQDLVLIFVTFTMLLSLFSKFLILSLSLFSFSEISSIPQALHHSH